MTQENLEMVRLDRWLFAARFYKTRTQAAAACEGGKVKVNGSSAKPHKMIHIGDELTIHVHSRYRNVEIKGLAQRGLPPAIARELYHEDVIEFTEEQKIFISLMKENEKLSRPKYKGRPTKRERRDIDKFKNGLF